MNNESQWYFVVDEQGNRRQEGPVSGAELAAMVSEGTLSPDTLVWQEGMADWEQIGALAEFQQPAPEEASPLESEPEPAAASDGEAASDSGGALDSEAASDSGVASGSEAAAAAPPAEEPPEPPDQVLLRDFANHSVHLSKSRNVLLVRTNDYHAGPLVLTKLDLLGFLMAMETAAQPEEPDAPADTAEGSDQEG